MEKRRKRRRLFKPTGRTSKPRKSKKVDEVRVQHSPGGIKGRWIVNSLSLVVVILAAVVIFVTAGITSYYYNNIRTTMTSRVNSITTIFRQYWTSTYDNYYYWAQEYVTNYELKEKIEVQFLNTAGRVQLSTSGLTADSIPGTQDVARALSELRTTSWMGEDSLSGERVMSVTSPMFNERGEMIGAVRLITSLAIAERQILFFVLIAMVASLLVFSIVVLSNRYFIKSILEPVMRVNVVAGEIAAGRYGMRLHKTHDDEIGQLCDSINHMSDEISRAERIKNEFISSVSHELRTPLTAIGGWSETLIAGGGTDPEEVMQGLEIIQKESTRLTHMVEELLDFARIESGRMKLEIGLFDLEIELFEAIYMYQNLLRNSDMILDYHTQEGQYYVNGDRHRIKQVFLNILDNAAKYGKSGGRIEVGLTRTDEHITMYVRDWGSGIPEGELPFVKDKFYKGSSKQRGSGIGLAVTDEIIKLHDGELTIQSKVGEGTVVYVTVPALQAHAAKGVETAVESEENSI